MAEIPLDNLVAEFHQGDATRLPLFDQSVDLVLGSPHYLEARTYGIAADEPLQEWLRTMVEATDEALRVSRGLVLWVLAGTGKLYIPGPEALLIEMYRRGVEVYRPAIWWKVDAETGGGSGIPGSGGKDWLRNDWEYVLAFKNRGDLPYAEPRWQKIPPKCPPGGFIRNRSKDGSRTLRNPADPKYVNPGNFFKVVMARVGGGHIGDKEAHETDAPYPEKLAQFFINGYCPLGGTVCDPFSGSGTTVCEAIKAGRNGIGFDLRESQVQLAERRLLRRIAEGRAT